jgi:hypothetical protein
LSQEMPSPTDIARTRITGLTIERTYIVTDEIGNKYCVVASQNCCEIVSGISALGSGQTFDDVFEPEPSQYLQDIPAGETVSFPIQVQGVPLGAFPAFFQMAGTFAPLNINQFIASLVAPNGAAFALFTQPVSTVATVRFTLFPLAGTYTQPIQTFVQPTGVLVGPLQAQQNFGVLAGNPNGVWTIRITNTGASNVLSPFDFMQLGFGNLPGTGITVSITDPGAQTVGSSFNLTFTLTGHAGDYGYTITDFPSLNTYRNEIDNSITITGIIPDEPGTFTLRVEAADMDGRKGGFATLNINVTGTATGVSTACCPDDLIPSTLNLTFASGTGDLAALVSTTLTYDGSTGWYSPYELVADGHSDWRVALVCAFGAWNFSIERTSGMITQNLVTDTVSSFNCASHSFSQNFTAVLGYSGSVTVSVS